MAGVVSTYCPRIRFSEDPRELLHVSQVPTYVCLIARHHGTSLSQLGEKVTGLAGSRKIFIPCDLLL